MYNVYIYNVYVCIYIYVYNVSRHEPVAGDLEGTKGVPRKGGRK